MRLWSTRESVRDGEPTLLAMAETLFSMAAYAWIGVHFGTWWHLWTAAALAPLMLLRTDESCEWGWRIAGHMRASIWARSKLLVTILALLASVLIGNVILRALGHAPFALAVMVAALVSGLAAFGGYPAVVGRIAGAVVGFVLVPIKSIAAIPGNWWRLAACTDFRRSPELIPHPEGVMPMQGKAFVLPQGEEQIALYHTWGVLGAFYREAKSHIGDSGALRIIWIILFLVAFTGAFAGFILPAVAFRLSVKATAIIWLPLIWAVQPPKPRGEPWPAHLKLKASSDFMRIVVFVSLLTLIGFAAKYVLWLGEYALATHEEAWHLRVGERLGAFIAALVRPGEIPLWQLLSAINALLAIAMFFMVRHWLRRAEVGLPLPERAIDRTLSTCYFFRRLLSSYAIVNNLVVFYYLASKLPRPPIGTMLFPWL